MTRSRSTPGLVWRLSLYTIAVVSIGLAGCTPKTTAAHGLVGTSPVLFDIYITGTETVTWNLDADFTDNGCTEHLKGDGKQTIQFESTERATFPEAAPRVPSRTPGGQAGSAQVLAHYDRQASPISVSGNCPPLGSCVGVGCVEGGPDCGKKVTKQPVDLEYAKEQLTLRGFWPGPYTNCPYYGPDCLLPYSGALSAALWADVAKPAFAVSSTGPAPASEGPVNLSCSTTLPPATVSADVHWTVTFCRNYDFLRSTANWATVHAFVDPILKQSPTFRDLLTHIDDLKANVERSDTPVTDPTAHGSTLMPSWFSKTLTIRLNWGRMDTICEVAMVVAHEYGHVDTFIDNPGLTAEMLAGLGLVDKRSYIDFHLQLELQANEFALHVLQEAAQNTSDPLVRDCIRAQILKDPILAALVRGDYDTARKILETQYCTNGCSDLSLDWKKTQAITDDVRTRLQEAVGQKASQLVASPQWQQDTAPWSPLVPSGIG